MRDVVAHGGPFVAAVEATRMPMVVTDPSVVDNPIIYANATFLTLCGYGHEEVLGQNYFSRVGEHADPEVAQRVEATMTARRTFIEEVPFAAKNGQRIWVSMFASPVVEDDRVVQHFASFLDVTDRIERERELREAKETLEQRVAARTRSMEQANTLLQGEVERRQRTEAILRDALARGEEDLRYRDFLIREVNHRTKNALQPAISLLGVQARATGDPASRGTLEAAMGRLRRIGDVHALLTYGSRNPNRIDFADYLDRLCRDTAESMAPERVRVEVEATDEAVWEPDLVLPLGLIAARC
ncbi:histidine kinase dimerization/phosphoacceptor domain -containing protein [Belnapia moabensis]|uniref:histidine kinase dimerization/phosphoacceptor domain -containing protein n=1 Tax=Belnapia moabensis TaxID=365533 RepID=UPI0005BA2008|nr:histidine kinase dimerization/phosphoacceptor domain -containing protein [Belnapia moabensis]